MSDFCKPWLTGDHGIRLLSCDARIATLPETITTTEIMKPVSLIPGFALMLLCSALPCIAADAALSAESVVRQTSRHMLRSIAAEREALADNPQRLYRMVDSMLGPYVDYQRMARWILGKHWRRANATQRQRFTNEFRQLLIRTYATALLEYNGQPITYLAPRNNDASSDVTVRTEISPANGTTIPVNYHMQQKDNRWMLYDISIDGISLVTNYRSSFASQMRRHGSLDALIEALAARNHSR
jgi:phospholipid transport system substrate-binding protein